MMTHSIANVNALPSRGGGTMKGAPHGSKADGAKGSPPKLSGKKGNRSVGATKGASGKMGSGYRR